MRPAHRFLRAGKPPRAMGSKQPDASLLKRSYADRRMHLESGTKRERDTPRFCMQMNALCRFLKLNS